MPVFKASRVGHDRRALTAPRAERISARLRNAVKRLDRPGGRTLLRAVVSIYLSVRYRTPIVLHRWNGAWAYRWRGMTIPHPVVGSALHPEEARAIFGYGYVPQPGDIVFDVGAGVGDSTLYFSRLVGHRGRVVAIEAHPDTFRWLIRLCELNGLANALPLQCAASDSVGEVSISDEESLTNAVVDRRAARNGIRVPARTIDDVAGELGIERVDLLKMNIEGAEREAVVGMEKTLAKTRFVCVSCHDFLAERGGPDELRTKEFVTAFLREHGFAVVSRNRGADSVRSYVYGTNRKYPDAPTASY